MRRVLVTRPEPGASATAARLREIGGLEPIVLPLTRIEPLHARPPPDTAAFDALVLTSANAVRMASSELLTGIRDLPCYAVGPATAEIARAAGLNVVLASGGDARSLSADIISRCAGGARLLYLCGRVRTPALESALRDAGIEVEPLEVYVAQATEHASLSLRDRVDERPVDLALVHSPRGGELLADIMSRPELADLFAGTIIISISAKAAEALAGREVYVAEEPSEQALLALVKAKV
jgi:uroporphyrinogen-III synthase